MRRFTKQIFDVRLVIRPGGREESRRSADASLLHLEVLVDFFDLVRVLRLPTGPGFNKSLIRKRTRRSAPPLISLSGFFNPSNSSEIFEGI
jgi:hypothetical protein